MGKGYNCKICDKRSQQKSHHEAHLETEGHKDKRKIKELELGKNDFHNKEGKKMNDEEKNNYINNLLQNMENSKLTDENSVNISNKYIQIRTVYLI